MIKPSFFLLAAAALATPALGAALSDYTNASSYFGLVSEASAVTYNRDTDSLFVIGDEGGSVFEYNKQGQQLSSMRINGFDSASTGPEGLTYLGGGKFLIASENIQTAYEFTYAAGGSVTRTQLPAHVFAPGNVGNQGLEGVAYDPVTNSVWGVKENNPSAVYRLTDYGTSNEMVLTNPNGLVVPRLKPNGETPLDFADIYSLSATKAFEGTDRASNLLILSQESNVLFEVTPDWQVVSALDLDFLGRNSIEGVTMDDFGTIYLVAEQVLGTTNPNDRVSALFVLTAVPEPATTSLLLGASGLAFVGLRLYRQRVRRKSLPAAGSGAASGNAG